MEGDLDGHAGGGAGAHAGGHAREASWISGPESRRGWRRGALDTSAPGGAPGDGAPAAPPTSRLAAAAVVAGVLGFWVTPVGAAALPLGILALRRMREREERGRGLAVAGTALGGVWLLVLLAGFATGGGSGPARDADGRVTAGGTTTIQHLRAGDCFSGGLDGSTPYGIAAVPCSSPHDGQVVAVVELREGEWPGYAEARAIAEEACSVATDSAPLDEDEALTFSSHVAYPDSPNAWEHSRNASCALVAPRNTRVTVDLMLR